MTLPPEILARTTQKRVSLTTSPLASLETSAVTTTWERSSEMAMDLTSPIMTSLYFSLVLPASSPSPVLNEMVMVWPRSTHAFTAMESPMMAATMGMIQTSWMEKRLLGSLTASGTSCISFLSKGSVMKLLF